MKPEGSRHFADAAQDRAPILEVRNLFKQFGDAAPAVNDVSLTVRDGEFVFLIGPSGCGKTTTLRMIGGYETPSSGDVVIRGERINDVPLEKRNIGMVFQSYALFPHMTVAENVGYGLRMRGAPKAERAERVAAALELVELTDFAKRYPRQLSGGQRQRVAIARVVVYEPDILLLDEPLANLDKRLRDAMRLELKKLQEKVGITTLYVTHDQEEALSMADKVAVMDGGNLVQYGTPDEVYNAPRTKFVASFLGDTTAFEGEVSAVSGDVASVDIGAASLRVAPSDGLSLGERITVSVRPERVRVSAERPGGDADNVHEGEIEDVSYLGSQVSYLVRVGALPALVRASELLPAGRPAFAEGDRAYVSWRADQAVCLKS